MKLFNILLMSAAAVGSIALSSCGCCTGVERPPALRSLPEFSPLPSSAPAAPAHINYAK